PSPKKIEAEAENIPIEVLFEDEHLIVVNKAAGLTVHPCTTQTEGTLVNALLFHIKDLKGIGGALRPGIVHRLDKDTSGALVVAKSESAHQRLVSIFSKHDIQRTYRCFCYGSSKLVKGTIQSTLGRNPRDRKKMAANIKDGKVAITHYQKLQSYGLPHAPPFASHFAVTLETGRTHQIRVHLTAEGFSLLGDPTYGTPTERQPKWVALPAEIKALIEALPGQALHAQTLGFHHPLTGEALLFEAPPPKSFLDLQMGLERFSALS
ncbi:RluA family pseudouridine synthase, partial [Bdellovibrionota bacterium FG-1]